MLKKIATLLLFVFLLVTHSSIVFAGDYTSTDINKNNFFQRIDAIEYAARHVENRNVLYAYFRNGNCTNFVSQCLFRGGMPHIFDNSHATRNWYMYPYAVGSITTWSYSHTWTVAHDFRYNWGNVNGVGWDRSYQYKIYSSAYALRTQDSLWNDLYYRSSAGDVIQYVRGPSHTEYGKTYHSQLIHRRSQPNSAKKISMAQNTPDGWRNLRTQSLPGSVADTIICLIRIKNVQRPIDTVNP